MNDKTYWADACTKNCVWLFQIKTDNEWHTENVFLTREEAKYHGNSRPYAYGNYLCGWRVYGVRCMGLIAELLGKHVKEFENEVDRINKEVN
jgi:hypothetical protein